MHRKNKLVYVSCSEPLRATIIYHAAQQGMNISEWTRQAIREKLRYDHKRDRALCVGDEIDECGGGMET